jgi:hypothetical protein
MCPTAGCQGDVGSVVTLVVWQRRIVAQADSPLALGWSERWIQRPRPRGWGAGGVELLQTLWGDPLRKPALERIPIPVRKAGRLKEASDNDEHIALFGRPLKIGGTGYAAGIFEEDGE